MSWPALSNSRRSFRTLLDFLTGSLEEDAKELGSKLLPRVIVARLGDYYRILRKLDEGALFLTTTSINEDKEASKDNASEAISGWEMDD